MCVGAVVSDVTLDQLVSGDLLPTPRDRGRHRRSARVALTERGEIELFRLREIHHRHVHGGDEGGPCAAIRLDGPEHGDEIEAADGHERRAHVRHHVHLAFHPGDVEPGQDAEPHVVVARAYVDVLQLTIRNQVAVRDLRCLGGAGRAGGVLQQSGIGERPRDLRLQLGSGVQDVQQRLGAGPRPAVALQERGRRR